MRPIGVNSLETLSAQRLDELLRQLPQRPRLPPSHHPHPEAQAGPFSGAGGKRVLLHAVGRGGRPAGSPCRAGRDPVGLALSVIGNGDAHGKNDSLLHYSLAPSLAPLYDLLSTVVYEELTKRLAMSIDGAIKIEEVDGRAWSRLADEVGVSPRFLEQRMGAFVEQVVGSALALSENPEFAGPVAEGIVAGIAARAERFEQPGLNPGGPAPQRHTKERA